MKKQKLESPSISKRSRRGITRWREPRTEFLFPELSENPWRIVGRKRDSATKHGSVESLTTLELCAGAGGQALGLEQAGLEHAGLVELDSDACATLRMNRPSWKVIEEDLNHFDGRPFKGVDIVSGGLPCPPFSVAGKQLGTQDERNLFLRNGLSACKIRGAGPLELFPS